MPTNSKVDKACLSTVVRNEAKIGPPEILAIMSPKQLIEKTGKPWKQPIILLLSRRTLAVTHKTGFGEYTSIVVNRQSIESVEALANNQDHDCYLKLGSDAEVCVTFASAAEQQVLVNWFETR